MEGKAGTAISGQSRKERGATKIHANKRKTQSKGRVEYNKGGCIRVSEDSQEGNHAVMDLSATGFKAN